MDTSIKHLLAAISSFYDLHSRLLNVCCAETDAVIPLVQYLVENRVHQKERWIQRAGQGGQVSNASGLAGEMPQGKQARTRA